MILMTLLSSIQQYIPDIIRDRFGAQDSIATAKIVVEI